MLTLDAHLISMNLLSFQHLLLLYVKVLFMLSDASLSDVSYVWLIAASWTEIYAWEGLESLGLNWRGI